MVVCPRFAPTTIMTASSFSAHSLISLACNAPAVMGRIILAGLCGNYIQANRNSAHLDIAGVVEHAKALNPVNMRKSRESQKMPEELFIQANEVIVVFVDVAAENHPHDKITIFH